MTGRESRRPEGHVQKHRRLNTHGHLGTKVKKGHFSIRVRFLVSGYKTVMHTSMFSLEIQAGHQPMKNQKRLNS